MPSLVSSVRNAYNLYYYTLPFAAMSSAECTSVHLVNASILGLLVYLVMTIVPPVVTWLLQTAYYYLTVHFVTVNIIVSAILIGRNIAAKNNWDGTSVIRRSNSFKKLRTVMS